MPCKGLESNIIPSSCQIQPLRAAGGNYPFSSVQNLSDSDNHFKKLNKGNGVAGLSTF